MTEETEMTKPFSQRTDELYRKLSKRFCEGRVKAEENIKKYPLPYVAGTFIGGLIIGCLITRKRTK